MVRRKKLVSKGSRGSVWKSEASGEKITKKDLIDLINQRRNFKKDIDEEGDMCYRLIRKEINRKKDGSCRKYVRGFISR